MEDKKLIPDWLVEQERNSWQIELLISGGFIFTLVSLPEFLRHELLDVIIHNEEKTYIVLIFIFGVLFSRALLIGFSVNLLLRSIWVAFLGIHYAFPKGVDYSRLKYSKAFEEKLKAENNGIDRILKLEKYCSLSYSLAIIIIILSFGVALVMTIFFVLVDQFDWTDEMFNNPIIGYSGMLLVMMISFGLLDKIFFQVLKKNQKWTQRFYPASKFISKITFTSIYRYEWFTLISNVKRWRLYLVTFSYFLLAFLLTINDLNVKDGVSANLKFDLFETRQYKNLPVNNFYLQNDEYDNLLGKESFVEAVSIPSEEIHGHYLPIFITYKSYFDNSFQNFFREGIFEPQQGILKTRKEFDENGEKLQDILRQSFLVFIDDDQIDAEQWYYRKHAITNQDGFYTRIDISDLEDGKHELNMKFVGYWEKNNVDTFTMRWIPFWKTGTEK
ncbi:MAG: hypothetical protein AAF573_05570 [Bacteroidota bacterium]